jgi:hypothetical protein
MLIFGGYNSHIRNLNTIELALGKVVATVSLRPNSVYKLHHLNNSFNGPPEMFYGGYKDALLPISMWRKFP